MKLEYTYFSNAFIAVLNTSLVLKFIYCWYLLWHTIIFPPRWQLWEVKWIT